VSVAGSVDNDGVQPVGAPAGGGGGGVASQLSVRVVEFHVQLAHALASIVTETPCAVPATSKAMEAAEPTTAPSMARKTLACVIADSCKVS
jgi:hypothetical protein